MLTVLLATMNRKKVFTSALEAFSRLHPPSSGWKLVVVDNGSSDGTEEAVRSFCGRIPLEFLKEPKKGKNFALNTGLARIEGDLTVLTDDDVFPREDWLVELRNAADLHPEFTLFGGAIVPYWEVNPPAWTHWADQGAAYAITDSGWEDGPISATCVWGPNMAVRTSVFHAGIRFDTSIGPRGTSYVQGGDTEFTRRLESLGHKSWYVPGAVVRHFIRSEQLDKSWVMRRAVRHGRGEFRLGQTEELSTRRVLLGAPRYLYRKLYTEGRQMAKAWFLRREEDLYRAHWRFNYVCGQIKEARAISRERKNHVLSAAL